MYLQLKDEYFDYLTIYWRLIFLLSAIHFKHIHRAQCLYVSDILDLYEFGENHYLEFIIRFQHQNKTEISLSYHSCKRLPRQNAPFSFQSNEHYMYGQNPN